jgi:hypothetical protein
MRQLTGLVAALILLIPLTAQAPLRLVTIEGLRQFPSYYHLQSVVVRGTPTASGHRVTLRSDTGELQLLLPAGSTVPKGLTEARGTFVDVGKLNRMDPRLTGYERTQDDDWPGPGEELLLRADRVHVIRVVTSRSLRTLALEPWKFEGQVVTMIGRFRGRNLFGDQPDAPKVSRYDFVLKSGNAAVWVTGRRPRSKGFDLDINVRVDSRYWLEVTGTVRFIHGLVRIEATEISEAAEPPILTTKAAGPPLLPPPSPPVEVIFSDPTFDEVDVPLATTIRVQFSRNINEVSLIDQIHVAYTGTTDLTIPDWTTAYNPALRALTITFSRPLDPDVPVTLELDEGILGFDKVALVPWTLTFKTTR